MEIIITLIKGIVFKEKNSQKMTPPLKEKKIKKHEKCQQMYEMARS